MAPQRSSRLNRLLSVMGDGKDGISRPDRLSNYPDITEANLRQQSLRLLNGIEAIDSFRKAGNRTCVFLRRESENESAIRFHYTTDLPKMDEPVVREIQRAHGVYAVKVCMGVGNLIATLPSHPDFRHE